MSLQSPKQQNNPPGSESSVLKAYDQSLKIQQHLAVDVS